MYRHYTITGHNYESYLSVFQEQEDIVGDVSSVRNPINRFTVDDGTAEQIGKILFCSGERGRLQGNVSKERKTAEGN